MEGEVISSKPITCNLTIISIEKRNVQEFNSHVGDVENSQKVIICLSKYQSRRSLIMGEKSLPIEILHYYLQFLTRIVRHNIYLILCDFHWFFKTIRFFKISVSYLTKN